MESDKPRSPRAVEWHGAAEQCPGCGMCYRDLKTGLSFAEVKKLMFDNEPDPKNWKYKRRNTVLGYWHELKKEMWDHHIEGCFKTQTGVIPF